MTFEENKFKPLLLGAFLVLIMGGTVSGYNYLLASNTLEDKISVTRDPKDLLELGYAPGAEIGDENKEITVGEWSKFKLQLKNPNGSKSENWDNIHIRGKFFGIPKENVSISILENGKWKDCTTYDLRLLNLNENGAGAYIGPENGWKLTASTQKTISLRLKIEEHVENMGIQFQAATSSEKNYEMFPSLKDSKSKKITYPIEDTYTGPQSTGDKNSSESHLEVASVENGHRYALLSFEIENIPENVKSASLNIHQYWGSNFSDLRKQGVSIELYSIENYERAKQSQPEEIEKSLCKKIDEEKISGNGKWYHFKILNHIRKEDSKKRTNLVLKLELENLKNESSRIRFYSREGKHSPSITFE